MVISTFELEYILIFHHINNLFNYNSFFINILNINITMLFIFILLGLCIIFVDNDDNLQL